MLSPVPRDRKKESVPTADIFPLFYIQSRFLLHFDPLAGRERRIAGTPLSSFPSSSPFSAQTRIHTHPLTHLHRATVRPCSEVEEKKVHLACVAGLAWLCLVAGALGRGESRLGSRQTGAQSPKTPTPRVPLSQPDEPSWRCCLDFPSWSS